MLQPLLENAVKHGVDKLRDKSAKRLIRLTARREGGDLRFTVYNTGSVIQPQVLRSVFVEKTQGYGLRNVDERIRLLFGEAYGIRICLLYTSTGLVAWFISRRVFYIEK